jgi:hypothetical protein
MLLALQALNMEKPRFQPRGIFLYIGIKCFSDIFAEYTQKNSILGIKEYSYQEEKEIDVGGA